MPEVMLSATALDKQFGGVKAVSGVTLEAHRDEVHAVIGPNGAGKSTLVNLLSGDIRPDAGRVVLCGQDITRHAPARRAGAGLGRSYQKTSLFPAFTVFENIRLAAQAHGSHPLRMFGRAQQDKALAAHARNVMAEMGLLEREGVRAGLMSHGEQRQLEMAMALATHPKVILLDEPLAGMGQAEAARMITLIRRLKQGRAVLLVEHDMDAVFALADRLTVMADGKVIASGAPEHVRTHPQVRAAYLGDAFPHSAEEVA
jgi:branched-chain amino acid transport system ATP-binding protein